MAREYMGDSKLQTLRMRYLLQSTGRPKRVVVSQLNDTVVRFCRSEFTPQCAKKVVSNSLELVDFAIKLTGQVKFLGKFK